MRLLNYFFALLLLLLAIGLQAQTTKSFVFHKDGKEVLVVPSNQIDSITFSVNDDDPDPVPPTPPIPDDYMVDLGLSVKWASCNVGATKPGETGNYYRWAETEPAIKFYFIHLVDLDADNIPICISGTDYDVARKEWGGLWRIPTGEEMEELVRECEWKWTYADGHFGAQVTGPNGNSIFLPAAGYYPNYGGDQEDAGRLNDLDVLGRYTTGNDLFKGNGWHQIQYAELSDAGARMVNDYWEPAIPVRPVYGETNWALTPRPERNNLGQIDRYGDFDTWTHNDNWGSFYLPESWYGVSLNSEGHVTTLNLEDNNLGQVIDIDRLPWLQHLFLSHNSKLSFIELENVPHLENFVLDDVPSLNALTVDSLPYVEISNYPRIIRFSGIYDNLILHQGDVVEQNMFSDAQVKNLTLNDVVFKTHFKPELQTLTLQGTVFSQDESYSHEWTARVNKRFECHDSNIDYIIKPSDFADGCEMIFDNTTIRTSLNTVKTLNCTFTQSVENWIKFVVE